MPSCTMRIVSATRSLSGPSKMNLRQRVGQWAVGPRSYVGTMPRSYFRESQILQGQESRREPAGEGGPHIWIACPTQSQPPGSKDPSNQGSFCEAWPCLLPATPPCEPLLLQRQREAWAPGLPVKVRKLEREINPQRCSVVEVALAGPSTQHPNHRPPN